MSLVFQKQMGRFSKARNWYWALAAALATLLSNVPIARSAEGTLPRILTDSAQNADVVFNLETDTNDTEACLAVLEDGSVWSAWHAYRNRKDRILARRVGPGALGPIVEITEQGGVHDHPVLVSCGDSGAWVFWSSQQDGRWRILGREFREGKWLSAETLSGAETDAFMPSAADMGNGHLALAWTAAPTDGPLQIRVRLLRKSKWSPAMAISDSDSESYRPVLSAEREGAVWAFWDRYSDGDYHVEGRRIVPEPGPVERVSPAGAYAITPTAITSQQGLVVAWLQLQDVVAKPGVISQMHSFRAARRTADGWEMLATADGDTAAATLSHGIMVKVLPKPQAKLGYMGRCRAPMLLQSGGDVWLLWDRKENPPKHPAMSTGQLVGRPFRDGHWQATVVLERGLIFYRIAEATRAVQNKFYFLASELPRKRRRNFHCKIGDLTRHEEFQQDKWLGWKPTELPFAPRNRSRHRIEVAGKKYQLYWADLHNHSTLTGDAEGEIDELLHYARDRAQIDVVALTDNDDIFDDQLNEAEYARATYFSRRISADDKFLALPGYEWTSHVPNDPKADYRHPRNWDYSWTRLNSRINHRTVIYPLSGGPLIRHTEVHNEIKDLFAIVRQHGGLAMLQHGYWKPDGDPLEVGMEVASGWGLHMRKPGWIHYMLDAGYRYAIMAHSDTHRRNPGLGGALTGVYAESLTDKSIIEAFKSRRIYGTSGAKIVLDARANGHLMGEEFKSSDGIVELSLHVTAPRRILHLTLVRNGETVARFSGTGKRTMTVRHTDKDLPRGTHWYYWTVQQEGEAPPFEGNAKVARGPFAWSSPHWVNVSTGESP